MARTLDDRSAAAPRWTRLVARTIAPTGHAAWARPFLALLVVLAVAACSAPAAADGVTGGTVSVLGSWEGPEEAAFMAMVAPFEAHTGIRVVYSATRDLAGELERGIAAGDPPDVAGLPGPGALTQLARTAALKDLTEVIDATTYKSQTIPSFVSLGTVDGRLVGVFIKATVKGLLWYDPSVWTLGTPRTWDELSQVARIAATEETRPWCVGLESGAASGWPGTDWIEDFLLRQSGPDAYDRWVAGDLPWTSSEVRNAFAAYGQVVADGAVAGGEAGALTTYFATAGRPLFTRPAGCLFLHQGSFMAPFLKDDPVHPAASFDFLPFPDVDPQYAGSLIAAGDLMGMIRDTPQARALVRYLVTAEAQSIWVKRGGVLSGNVRVDSYPDEISAREAHLLASATHVRFDASDAMPATMADAFLQAVLAYTRDQDRLDAILGRLDAVRASAYAD